MKPRKKPRQKRRKIQRRSQFFVYMLECCDGSYYTGYTNDLSRRVALHNKGGGSKYVRTRLPAKMVFSKSYKYYKLAVLEERRIKTLSRQQKDGLIQAYVKALTRRVRKTKAVIGSADSAVKSRRAL